MNELIYQKPADYELEHEGNTEDIEFSSQWCSGYNPSGFWNLLAVVAESLSRWRS
jgi:hypothetical protein